MLQSKWRNVIWLASLQFQIKNRASHPFLLLLITVYITAAAFAADVQKISMLTFLWCSLFGSFNDLLSSVVLGGCNAIHGAKTKSVLKLSPWDVLVNVNKV